MREIKFRGQRIDNKKWVYGYLWKPRKDIYIIREEQNGSGTPDFEVIPETVGQFTGLKDKNGKEIYEGSIIEYQEEGYPNNTRKKITFYDGCFMVSSSEALYEFALDECWAVVGNIHEAKPEQLKSLGIEK